MAEGLGTWQPRPNKTYQDRQPIPARARVKDAEHRLAWAQKHKPKNSSDWAAYRGRTD